MTDTDQRLRDNLSRLAEHEVPDASLSGPDEVWRKVRTAHAENVEVSTGRSRLHWPLVAAAALFVVVVVATVVVFARRAESPFVDIPPTPPPTSQAPVPQWASKLGNGWQKLPPPPNELPTVSSARQPIFVLGDRFLLAWTQGALPDGPTPAGPGAAAVLDLDAMTWRTIDPPPLASGDDAPRGGAWTGSEVVVWSTDGAATWSPVNGWRHTAPPAGRTVTAGGGNTRRDGVWTGTDVVFWFDGLAFSPVSGWRDVPRVPGLVERATAAWDGQEIMVMGKQAQDTPMQEVGYAYDPVRGAWRDVPASGLSPVSLSLTVHDGRFVAAAFDMGVATYDRASNSWHRDPSIPLASAETDMYLLSVGPYLVASSQGMAVRDSTGRWTPTAESTRGISVGDVLFDKSGDTYRVWIPPPPRDGRLPSPSNILFHPWNIAVPPGFTYVDAVNDDRPTGRTPGLVTVRFAAPDGECALKTSSTDVTPSWWNEPPEQARVLHMGTIAVSFQFGGQLADARIAIRGVVDDDAHAVVATDQTVVGEIDCTTRPSDLRGGRAAVDNARALLESLGLNAVGDPASPNPPYLGGYAPAAGFTVVHGSETLTSNWSLVIQEPTALTITMSVRTQAVICGTSFNVEPADGPSGQTVATLTEDRRQLREGNYTFAVQWNARRSDGAPVRPGRYRLVAALAAHEACSTGQANDTISLGTFIVPQPATTPRTG